ncbi:MAG: hypothetical protein Ct9H300mP6_01490 [Gammaproteobacteria bacterium]|nr:MAG: hypothetical protein Ct9H300mP6_01490 [Gammaproteobacteria bacterium]
MTYIDNTRLDNLVAEYISGNEPIYSVVNKEKIEHSIWKIDDMNSMNDAISAINDLESLYIADGHHRSAAASKVRESKMNANSQHTGNEEYNYFLAVAFPKSKMTILDYNRLIKEQ